VIRDYKLVVIVNLLLVIDLVILSTWQIVDPPFRIVRELLIQVRTIPYSQTDTDSYLLLVHLTTSGVLLSSDDDYDGDRDNYNSFVLAGLK